MQRWTFAADLAGPAENIHGGNGSFLVKTMLTAHHCSSRLCRSTFDGASNVISEEKLSTPRVSDNVGYHGISKNEQFHRENMGKYGKMVMNLWMEWGIIYFQMRLFSLGASQLAVLWN